MTLDTASLRQAIQAKSDQINAVDLVAGPLVCQIVDVTRGDSDQPVSIKVDAHKQPWKPSKTSLRVLCACWGDDPSVWIGRWVVLYNDESVKWAGQAVGGIRTSHLSHIDGPKVIMVNETRGKKTAQRVEPYYPQEAQAPKAELPYYSDEAFEENLPKWRDLISEGSKTADQIIVAIKKKAKLTARQEERIRAPIEQAAPEPEEAPPVMEEPRSLTTRLRSNGRANVDQKRYQHLQSHHYQPRGGRQGAGGASERCDVKPTVLPGFERVAPKPQGRDGLTLRLGCVVRSIRFR